LGKAEESSCFGDIAGFAAELDWRFAAAGMGVGVAAFGALRWAGGMPGRSRGTDDLLALTINNMTQGVVMFDAAGKLVVCNDRYIEMYGLPRDIVKPGCTLLDVIKCRQRSGSLKIPPSNIRPTPLLPWRKERP
jgi:PAS domain-containing protein